MLHQDSQAALNEVLEREKDELKNKLKLAEQRSMYLTRVHEPCHDTKQALEKEIMQLTGQLEKATLESKREKEELKNELKLAEQRLMYQTSVHEQCHDTKQALENEIMQLTGRLEKATLESNTTDSMQIVNEHTLQVTPVDTPVNNLMQIENEQTLQVTPVDTPVNDSMQIVNEQTLQVTPVDTSGNDFVSSMTCFKPPCCHTSNDSLLQKIESLEGIINEYEKMIHPIPLFSPGRLGYNPDGSEDPEARAIIENALKLGISAENFENLCMAFHESLLTKRVGNDNAVADIFERIGSLIQPDSADDDKIDIFYNALACSARMLVCNPEIKDNCRNLERKYQLLTFVSHIIIISYILLFRYILQSLI
jgi:hypothetical protein